LTLLNDDELVSVSSGTALQQRRQQKLGFSPLHVPLWRRRDNFWHVVVVESARDESCAQFWGHVVVWIAVTVCMQNVSGKSILDAQAPNRGRWAFGPAKVSLRMQPCPLTALPRSFKVVPQQRELYVAHGYLDASTWERRGRAGGRSRRGLGKLLCWNAFATAERDSQATLKRAKDKMSTRRKSKVTAWPPETGRC